MPAHGFQKSEKKYRIFLPVYILDHRQAKNGDGKKNMGVKKIGCKKSHRPPPVSNEDMSADHDYFYVRPNSLQDHVW